MRAPVLNHSSATRLGAALLALMLLAAATTTIGASPAVANSSHQPQGMVITESTMSFDDTWTTLIDTLDANPNITIIKTIDHAAGAAGAGTTLEPTREVFFGNPALGTPLMQSSQTVGIDLPQKMIVWEESGTVYLGYNSPDYLAARHDLSTPQAQARLQIIGGALAGIAGVATGAVVDPVAPGIHTVSQGAGLVVVDTAFGVPRAVEELKAAIAARPLNLVLELDHSMNAMNAGLQLAPTTLLIFGNPAVGSPLMQASRTTAIDLPQKMLVWEDQWGTHIAYNDPLYLRDRHDITGQDPRLGAISGVLAAIAGEAVPQVAFVAGNDKPPSGDRPVLSRLAWRGHDVTVIDDDDLDTAMLDGYDMAIVSSSVMPGNIPADLGSTSTPVLSWEWHAYDELAMAIRAGKRQLRGTAVQMNPATSAHPLSGGLTYSPSVYETPQAANYGVVGGDAIVIASERRGAEQPVYFAYEDGTTLADGTIAPARRTAFFPNYVGFSMVSSAGWHLFDAATSWTLGA